MQSRSKYKGGFEERNGRKNNTSEYNHNYYVRNKEKWRKKYNKLQDWLGFDERDARDEAKEQFDDAWIDYMLSQHKYIGLSGDVIEKGRKYFDAGNAFYKNSIIPSIKIIMAHISHGTSIKGGNNAKLQILFRGA